MRGLLTVTVPRDLTARQLGAMAALLDRIECGSWRYLASSFDRLDGGGAVAGADGRGPAAPGLRAAPRGGRPRAGRRRAGRAT